MLKILGSFGNSVSTDKTDGAREKFTRFAHVHERRSVEHPTSSDKAVRGQQRISSLREASSKEAPSKPKAQRLERFDANAHLYADTHIPISILRRALPSRFSMERAEKVGIAAE